MKNKIKKGIVFLSLILILSFNVMALDFVLNRNTDLVLPICTENQFLLYSSGNWTCADYSTGSGLTLICNNSEIIVYNSSSLDWECSEYPTGTGGSSFNLTCSIGQTTTYNGTDWVCADVVTDTNLNTIYSCSIGQILEYNGTAFECGTDSTGSDDQTLFEVLSEGNSANS